MTDSQILLWDDNPSELDLLGFEDVAAPVLQALDREHLDPVCVGVFGPWGAGKTTVLQLIQSSLLADDDKIVVYTQPWSYDPATDPKATLIGEVLSALRGHLKVSPAAELSNRFAALAKRVRWARVIRLTAYSALTASAPALADLEGLFGKDEELADPTLRCFREEFGELLSHETFEDLKRIIVVVDDLDRCLPETVIDTLEAIKLFLSVPKMAFVVAADETAVARAIATAFGSSPDGNAQAQRYLEKIVQIPVRVPALGLGDVEAYVAQLLLWHRVRADSRCFEPIRTGYGTARSGSERGFIEDLTKEIDGANDDIALAERLAPILYEELSGNPRRIKRLLNAYWIRKAIAQRRGIDFEAAAFAKLVLLEEAYPSDFRTVLGWLSDGTINDRLSQLEGGGTDFPSTLRRWGRLDPAVSDLEVGRYLILAAALQGTIVTVSSLPSELRAIADKLTATTVSQRRSAETDIPGLDIASRSILSAHLAESIRFQPSRQRELGESLMAVVGESEQIASEAAIGLKRMPASDVAPALIVTLAPPAGKVHASLIDLIAAWLDSGELAADAANAARVTKEANE